MVARIRILDQAERCAGETPWFSRRRLGLALVDRAMTGRAVLEQDRRDVLGERDRGSGNGMRVLARRLPARRERERTGENGAGAKTESDEEILPAELAAHQGTGC
jgi:hypothetical protein